MRRVTGREFNSGTVVISRLEEHDWLGRDGDPAGAFPDDPPQLQPLATVERAADELDNWMAA